MTRRSLAILLAFVLPLAITALADAPSPSAAAPVVFDFEKGAAGWASATDGVEARVVPVSGFSRGGQALETAFSGKETGICLKKLTDLSQSRAITFDTLLPKGRAEMRVLVYFIDEDDFWYQSWLRISPEQGKWSAVEVDLRPGSGLFLPMGHSRPWCSYAAHEIKEIGIRVFADRAVTGAASFDNITLVPAAPEAQPQMLLNFETSSTEVPCYRMFEITFELSRTYENPFDPAQILVSASFQSASGRKMNVEGFFYQEFERRRDKRVESLIPVGAPKWKIRFSPPETGEWTYEICVKDSDELRLAPRRFTCVPSDMHGCVRVASDKRHFEFEDGTFFYPIGHNIPASFNEKAARELGVVIEMREGTLAFDRYLAGMQKAGENYARIWLAVWSFGLEWSRKYHPSYRDLGRYNLQNAWRFDYVLRQAEERGIYVQLALSAFGQWRQEQFEGDWPYSPYNVKNGGWLKDPQEFWGDERAQAMYQRMVRYVVARWGYSANIAAWEMCNEIDLVTGYANQKERIADWHRRCVETIRKYDPNPRLTTTNFASFANSPELLKMPEISFSSTNNYQAQILNAMRNQIFPLKSSYGKPAIMVECGYDFKGAQPETTRKYLHLCLWGSYMTPFAGAGMSWWWDFIDDRNLYGIHTPLVLFAAGEDLRNRSLEMNKGDCLASGGGDAANLLAITLQNDTSGYFWIYEKQLFRLESDALFTPQPRNGVQLSLAGFKDGPYKVEFWDTVKGGKVQELTAQAKEGKLRCDVPEFTGDIAGKVKPF